MKIWTIMNGAAWALSGFLGILIVWDFIQVERARRSSDREADGAKDDER
jgi:hypothetical protein